MATELKGRKIQRFRCHIDPMIGPKSRNAFDVSELKGAHFEMTPAGVYVKHTFPNGPGGKAKEEEHIIPFANVQSIKFLTQDDSEPTK